jgi:hypothetical protein
MSGWLKLAYVFIDLMFGSESSRWTRCSTRRCGHEPPRPGAVDGHENEATRLLRRPRAQRT